MKKILITLIILFISIFTHSVFAQDIFKITGANFDTSNSMIVLNIPDESSKPVLDEIKVVKMENPSRAYFDIPDSILTIPKQNWKFNTKGITEIKINQFTTNPNVVRVVIYYDDDFNPSNLKFVRIKNNIIIKLKNTSWQDEYFHRTYRDEHSSASDFYEYLTVEIPDETPSITTQIQQAFNTTTQQTPKMDTPSLIKKDLKLNTKYYISQITPRPNGVLLSGFGSVTIEKPMVLQNPLRIVYDIPNTLVNREIRNSEYQINETDTAKIGQFEVNKARIVITTPNVTKYIPVYSTDNQSLLIANSDKLDHKSLFSNTSDIISYNSEKNNSQTSAMILSFNHPIVHGIDRTNQRLILYLYNVARYNEDTFNETFKNTYFASSNIELLPGVGMKLTIPTEPDTFINTYLGADSKTLKVQVTTPKKTKPPFISQSSGIKKIVIDPGHGGSDVGAIRGDITEKEITLDVSKRVCALLEKKGYKVEMTRDTDKTVSLQDRVAFSESEHPDIFVSIHVNSSEKPEITGIETHYYRQESLSLAQTVHAALASNIKTKNRGLFKSKFYVINHTTAPAILVEIGFISNDGERAELVSDKRKQATAKAIAEGVENYFKENK